MMLRRGLSLALAITMTWHCWAVAAPLPTAPAPATTPSEQGLEPLLTQLADLGRKLRPMIDRSQFDLEALVERLDYDAEKIVAFVTDEIALEIYPGALRGARGTLISRAGNSLDQALLLATLLKDAGFDAVIRQARLSEADASALVESMSLPRKPAPSIWLEAPQTGDRASAGASRPDSNRAAWISTARTKADEISRTLDEAGIKLGSATSMDPIQHEARDYCWVDYRSDASGPWKSVHPVSARAPETEATATYSGEIPPELTHRVTMEVLVGSRRGAKTVVSPLIAPLELSSAHLAGAPVSFALVPDQFLNQDSPLNPQTLVDNVRFLLPLVNGKMPRGAKALSLRGLLVSADSLGSGAAGIFETVSEKSAQAVDALSALGTKSPDKGSAVTIDSLRLRVTFHSPDGTDRIAERELFNAQRDLTPAAIQAKEPGSELVSALARFHTLVFAIGSYSKGLVFDSVLAEMESLDSLLEAANNLDPETCKTLACLYESKWDAPDTGASLPILYLAFDEVLGEQHGGMAYRHTPNLVRLSRPLLPRPGEEMQTRIDILSNSKRAFASRDDQLEPTPADLVLAGVWETQIETDILEGNLQQPTTTAATAPDLIRFGPEDVKPHAAENGVARAMLSDLDAGFILLADKSLELTSSDAQSRWWRIDPATGETLGMNQFGGSELVKAVVLLLISAVFMATAQTVYSTADCWYNGDGSLRACYVCTNTAAMTLWSVAALWIATGLTFDEFTDWSYFEQKWELTTGCTAVIDG